MDWELRLVTLYDFVCKQYRERLWVYCRRFSPYADMTFTDEEVICIYLWEVMDKRREIKDIYEDRGGTCTSGIRSCPRTRATCNG